MAITQIIATLPAVLNDSETFYEDIAIRNNSLVTVSFPSVNTWATQANALAVEVNDKAAQVAAQAVDGGYSQDYINDNFFSQNYINDNFFSQNYINDNFVNQDINTLTNKTTPADADELVIADSASSFSLKKLSFTNLKATLLTYFDTLYSRTSAIFGIGQTWQNVTTSRSFGITYTNNTGKPIYVMASGGTTGQGYLTLIINGTPLSANGIIVAGSGTTMFAMVSGVIPNGATYSIGKDGSVSLSYWSELR